MIIIVVSTDEPRIDVKEKKIARHYRNPIIRGRRGI